MANEYRYLEDLKPEQYIPFYLMLSYLYYIEDVSIWLDTEYDKLCKRILEQYDNLEHRHKHLVDKGSLRAGTAYQLKIEDYPQVVIGAARYYAKDRLGILRKYQEIGGKV